MKTSQKGINLIKGFEGFRSEAYICPAGVLTIGYGHTKDVKKGQKVTEVEAENLLAEDLLSAEEAVNKMFRKGLPQNKFDALVSFAFNVGNGNFFSSTLLRKAQISPDDDDIRKEFERWVYGADKNNPTKKVILAGLKKRREKEADLFFETV